MADLLAGGGRRQVLLQRLALRKARTAGGPEALRRTGPFLDGAHPDLLQELPQLQVVVRHLRVRDLGPHLVHRAPTASPNRLEGRERRSLHSSASGDGVAAPQHRRFCEWGPSVRCLPLHCMRHTIMALVGCVVRTSGMPEHSALYVSSRQASHSCLAVLPICASTQHGST